MQVDREAKLHCMLALLCTGHKIFTFQGLEMGAVDILIVWENLEIHRIVLKNHQTDGKLRLWCLFYLIFCKNCLGITRYCMFTFCF